MHGGDRKIPRDFSKPQVRKTKIRWGQGVVADDKGWAEQSRLSKSLTSGREQNGTFVWVVWCLELLALPACEACPGHLRVHLPHLQ